MHYQLGLIGKNISYSLSPSIHLGYEKNYSFSYDYKIYDFSNTVSLEKFLSDSLKDPSIKGFNVTTPYKEYVANLLGLSTPVNTLYKEGGLWKGVNTDVVGFLKALTLFSGTSCAVSRPPCHFLYAVSRPPCSLIGCASVIPLRPQLLAPTLRPQRHARRGPPTIVHREVEPALFFSGTSCAVSRPPCSDFNSIVFLGSGGVVKSLVSHYEKNSPEVALTILSRRYDKNFKISQKPLLPEVFSEITKASTKRTLIVQATSAPHKKEGFPELLESLKNYKGSFLDLCYNPPSDLYYECKKLKIPCQDGLLMLSEQALESHKFWFP